MSRCPCVGWSAACRAGFGVALSVWLGGAAVMATPITIDDLETSLTVGGASSGTAGTVSDETYFADGVVPSVSIFAERGQFGLLTLSGTDADPSPTFSGTVAVASGTATIAIGRSSVTGRVYDYERNVVGINWTTGTAESPTPVDFTAGGNSALAFDVTSFTSSTSFDDAGGFLMRLFDADDVEALNVILAPDFGAGQWSIALSEFGTDIDLTRIMQLSLGLAAERDGLDSAYDAAVSITNIRLVPEPGHVGGAVVALAAAVWSRRRMKKRTVNGTVASDSRVRVGR